MFIRWKMLDYAAVT